MQSTQEDFMSPGSGLSHFHTEFSGLKSAHGPTKLQGMRGTVIQPCTWKKGTGSASPLLSSQGYLMSRWLSPWRGGPVSGPAWPSSAPLRPAQHVRDWRRWSASLHGVLLVVAQSLSHVQLFVTS